MLASQAGANRAFWLRVVASVQRRREPLLVAIVRKAAAQDLPYTEVAQALDITPGHLAQLLTGLRRVDHIGSELAERMADWLRTSKLLVLFASGQVRLEDFYTPAMLKDAVARARTEWPQLPGTSPLTAVMALTLAGRHLLPRAYLRELVAS